MLSKFRMVRGPLALLHRRGCCSNSHIRFNFHREVEEAISKQITEELSAGYTYYSMATVFCRDDVALLGFHKLFEGFAEEEISHAKGWVDYLSLRGGKAKFGAIKGPPDVDWTPLCATAKAIDMEIKMTQEILKLRALADKHHDSHLGKFIEDEYLVEQYDGLKKLGDLKTQIERAGDRLGLYILDYNILQKSPMNPTLMKPK